MRLWGFYFRFSFVWLLKWRTSGSNWSLFSFIFHSEILPDVSIKKKNEKQLWTRFSKKWFLFYFRRNLANNKFWKDWSECNEQEWEFPQSFIRYFFFPPFCDLISWVHFCQNFSTIDFIFIIISKSASKKLDKYFSNFLIHHWCWHISSVLNIKPHKCSF